MEVALRGPVENAPALIDILHFRLIFDYFIFPSLANISHS